MLSSLPEFSQSNSQVFNINTPPSNAHKRYGASLVANRDSEEISAPPANKCKKLFFRTITVGSVISDVPFVFFLWVAVYAGFRYLLTEVGISSSLAWDILAGILSAVLSGSSTFCDVVIANPIEEAEKLATPNTEDTLDKEINKMDSCKKKCTKALNYFNQAASNVTYVVGAAANALPIAYLSSQPAIQWGIGIPIIIYGVAYCNLISWIPVKKHAYEFIHRLLSCNSQDSMILSGFRNPAKSLELMIQSVSSALSRGAFFGYTINQLMQYVFKQNENNTQDLSYLYSMAVLTIYVTFFSRTLNVHKQFFNDAWGKVSQETLQAVRVSRKGIAFDMIIALLRGIPTAVLLYRHSKQNTEVNLLISAGVGSLIFSHTMYVRYIRRLYQTALKQRAVEERLLDTSSISVESNENAETMFNHLHECLKTKELKSTVTSINAAARVGRSLALFGFLLDLNETLAKNNVINLDLYDLLCLHQLWGNTSLENEFSFFQENVVDNLAYYRTKWRIEKSSSLFGWGAFWKVKQDYPKENLQRLTLELSSDMKVEVINKEETVSKDLSPSMINRF